MKELLLLLRDRYDACELIHILKLDSDIIIDNMTSYIEDNYDDIHGRIIDDEVDHFGFAYGEDNDDER